MAVLSGFKESGGSISSEASTAISIARVLCIFFMSYVHLRFFCLNLSEYQGFRITSTVISDMLGRSSVPLLSVISGYLVVRSIHQHGGRNTMNSRFMTLIVPMVIWNCTAVVMLGVSHASVLGVICNDILSMFEPPRLVYLAFLRDIFVLTLMAPALMLAFRKATVLTAVIIFTLYVIEPNIHVILRPQILFFYAIGVLFSLKSDRLRKLTPIETLFVFLFFLVIIVTQIAGEFVPTLKDILSQKLYDNLVRRPGVACATWVICLRLAQTGIGQGLAKAKKGVFLFFLSHGLIYFLCTYLLSSYVQDMAPWMLLVAWIFLPILVFAATLLARDVLERIPYLQFLLGISEGNISYPRD